VDFSTLEAQLSQRPEIRAITLVNAYPWGRNANSPIAFARTPDVAASTVIGARKAVGHDYFLTLDLDLLAGRAFDRAQDGGGPAVGADGNILLVVDEAYSRALGFATPQAAVDQTIYLPGSGARDASTPLPPARIIGVTETEMTQLEAGNSEGSVYLLNTAPAAGRLVPLVRVAPSDVDATVAAITEVWDMLAPDFPVNIRFLDQLFEQRFRPFAQASLALVLLGSSSLMVSITGLVGMAMHVAGRRRHEISIRKILGSSTARVLGLILWGFSKPVLIGNLIAWPFAYVAAQAYLRAFSEQIALTPTPFVFSLVATLLVAGLTVGIQAIRAAQVKPAAGIVRGCLPVMSEETGLRP
jgi:putative ABC transport system permease protein